MTRYVESVSRSRLVARTLKSRSQSILTCEHDGCLAVGFSVLLASKTNHAFDVGQEYKRYIFMSKMGVVKPKGIFCGVGRNIYYLNSVAFVNHVVLFVRYWKHIIWFDFFSEISEVGEEFYVSCQRGGIARNINYSDWRE